MTGTKTDVAQFRRFHMELIAGAPEGYTPHYIILGVHSKDPARGFGWTRKPLTFEEAKRELESGVNIGIAAREGDPLVIVDIDDIESINIEKMKETLIARSRKRLGFHCFYFNTKSDAIPNISTDDEGEVRSQNQYVVAAGSFVRCSKEEIKKIPEVDKINAGKYTLDKMRAPAAITLDELPGIFLERHYKSKADAEQVARPVEEFKPHPSISPLFKLTFRDILPGVTFGARVSHPLHGGDTGTNFIIRGDLAHCWRHNVSLSPVQFLAVKAGLMTCLDAGTGHQNSGSGPSKLKKDDKKALQAIWDYAVLVGLVQEADKKPATIEQEKRNKESVANQLIELADDNVAEFFTDQYGTPYAALQNNDHTEIYPLRGSDFRRWLSGLLWRADNTAAGSEALTAALNVLEARAAFEGRKIALSNRVAWYEGAIYYDLTNEQWEAVKITGEGWEIVAPPLLFRRYKHQKPQVDPVSGGDLKELLKFVNIEEKSLKHIFLVDIVSKVIPDIPHVIDIVHGSQGSAKTTKHRITKELIDPSELGSLDLPRDGAELVQKLEHNYFAVFDNVTNLQKWQSDILCRACTGEGFSKRQLYTDNEDVIYNYKRCVAINGINIAGTSPDFLDRSILYELKRISKSERKKEGTFWLDFKKAKPELLGAVFDAVSKAMQIKSKLNLKELPRMADFGEWGEAISRGMGSEHGIFLSYYFKIIGKQDIEAIEGHIIGPAILKLVEEQRNWKGSASELLVELVGMAEALKIDTKTKGWPKAPNALTRKLKELKTNLDDIDISVSISRNSKSNVSEIVLENKKKVEGLPREEGEGEETPEKFSGDLDALLEHVFGDNGDDARKKWNSIKESIANILNKRRVKPEVFQKTLLHYDTPEVIEKIKWCLGVKEQGVWLEVSKEGCKILGSGD